jgi:hypothetical protein
VNPLDAELIAIVPAVLPIVNALGLTDTADCRAIVGYVAVPDRVIFDGKM